jgi:hypothetical protein
VGVILREDRIGLCFANSLEDIRRVRSVVNIHGIASQRLSDVPRVTDEPSTIGVHETTALPWVVWCLTANDDLGALGNELLASLGKVVVVCVDGNCLTVVCRLACLGASTRADRTSVVAATEAAAVVVTEFHDDDVVWLYEVDDLVEAAFYGVRTGAAATDGFVDDWERDGVWEEDTPA